MLENAQDTRNINIRVPNKLFTGIPIRKTPRSNTNIPLTIPLTAPPMIYAKAISNPDNGAVNRSGSCCSNFICSIEEAVFEVAFVSVFIIISPGRINIVYGIPWISEIRCSKVNPKIAM